MSSEVNGSTKSDINGPILVLVRGLPGSGKTYLAEALQASIGPEKVVMLDPDKIDPASDDFLKLCESLRAEGVEEKFFPNRFLKAKGHAAITAHKIIFWNQPFSDWGGFERSVDNLRTFAAEHSIPLPILLVEVTVSPETAQVRIKGRKQQGGHGPSDGRFTQFISDYTSFAGKGYQTIEVSGEDDVQDSVSKVLTRLRKLD